MHREVLANFNSSYRERSLTRPSGRGEAPQMAAFTLGARSIEPPGHQVRADRRAEDSDDHSQVSLILIYMRPFRKDNPSHLHPHAPALLSSSGTAWQRNRQQVKSFNTRDDLVMLALCDF